jgi:hypothetical protein
MKFTSAALLLAAASTASAFTINANVNTQVTQYVSPLKMSEATETEDVEKKNQQKAKTPQYDEIRSILPQRIQSGTHRS